MMTALYASIGVLILIGIMRSRLRVCNGFEAGAVIMFWPFVAFAIPAIMIWSALHVRAHT